MAIVHPEVIETAKEMIKETEDAQRAAVLADVVKGWNGLVKGLLAATQGWEKYRRARLDNGVSLEEFPLECQKMFMLANPHGDFGLLVEDMMTHPRLEEHLKTLIVKIK